MAVGEKAEFVVRLAEPQDADEIARIYISLFRENALWGLMMADVEDATLQAFISNGFRSKIGLPQNRYFVAIDTSNQQIAGGASLSMPLEEGVPFASIGASENWPAGTNEKLAHHFYQELLTQSKTYGFEPTKHCHRSGTWVAKEYQRRGIGTLLTRYGNDLADSVKAGTYVGVIDSSIGLFKRHGFIERGHIDSRLKEYGGPDKVVRSTSCFRPAIGNE